MTPQEEQFLRSEFHAEEGSFLLQLRCDARWDDDRFTKLINAMHSAALVHGGSDVLPRWLAEGFWYLSWFVPEQVKHPAYLSQHDAEFYRERSDRLFNVVWELFMGEILR